MMELPDTQKMLAAAMIGDHKFDGIPELLSTIQNSDLQICVESWLDAASVAFGRLKTTIKRRPEPLSDLIDFNSDTNRPLILMIAAEVYCVSVNRIYRAIELEHIGIKSDPDGIFKGFRDTGDLLLHRRFEEVQLTSSDNSALDVNVRRQKSRDGKIHIQTIIKKLMSAGAAPDKISNYILSFSRKDSTNQLHMSSLFRLRAINLMLCNLKMDKRTRESEAIRLDAEYSGIMRLPSWGQDHGRKAWIDLIFRMRETYKTQYPELSREAFSNLFGAEKLVREAAPSRAIEFVAAGLHLDSFHGFEFTIAPLKNAAE